MGRCSLRCKEYWKVSLEKEKLGSVHVVAIKGILQ